MAADKLDGEEHVRKTWEEVSRGVQAAQQWRWGHGRRGEGLLGEIADVWQSRGMLGIRTGMVVLVLVRLVGWLVVKEPCRQADGG